MISAEGINTDPEKIIAVRDWPIPQNKKHLRRFLEFCSYYRKFVKGFLSWQNHFIFNGKRGKICLERRASEFV